MLRTGCPINLETNFRLEIGGDRVSLNLLYNDTKHTGYNFFAEMSFSQINNGDHVTLPNNMTLESVQVCLHSEFMERVII